MGRLCLPTSCVLGGLRLLLLHFSAWIFLCCWRLGWRCHLYRLSALLLRPMLERSQVPHYSHRSLQFECAVCSHVVCRCVVHLQAASGGSGVGTSRRCGTCGAGGLAAGLMARVSGGVRPGRHGNHSDALHHSVITSTLSVAVLSVALPSASASPVAIFPATVLSAVACCCLRHARFAAVTQQAASERRLRRLVAKVLRSLLLA